MKHLFIGIATWLLILPASTFYLFLQDTPQCFFTQVFPDQQLLAEIDTPIIAMSQKIVMRVTNNNVTLLERDIVNQLKITVPKQDIVLNDQKSNSTNDLEYQTCFRLEKQTPQEEQEEEYNPMQPKGYLLSVKLMTSFDHKVQAVTEKAQNQADYRQIQQLSSKLKSLNTEQISLHQINEAKQKLTQTYLQELKIKTIIYSLLQIVMLVVFTVIQVRMLRGYLRNLSVI